MLADEPEGALEDALGDEAADWDAPVEAEDAVADWGAEDAEDAVPAEEAEEAGEAGEEAGEEAAADDAWDAEAALELAWEPAHPTSARIPHATSATIAYLIRIISHLHMPQGTVPSYAF